MVPTIRLLFALGFCLSPTTTWANSGSAEREILHNFLESPNSQTFLTVSGSNKTACWTMMTESDPDLDQLSQLVSRGDVWAARYLMLNLRSCDGGALDSAYIALGQFGDRRMEQLLVFTQRGMISIKDLKFAVGTAPLTFVDHYGAGYDFLEARREKLERVNRADLGGLKRQALAEVEEAMGEMKSAMNSTPQNP